MEGQTSLLEVAFVKDLLTSTSAWITAALVIYLFVRAFLRGADGFRDSGTQRALLTVSLMGFFSVVAGVLISQGLSSILWALSFAGATFVAILDPSFALSFFLGMLFIRPWELDPNNTLFLALPRLLAVMTAGSFFLRELMNGRLRLLRDRPTVLMLIFGLLVFASTFVTRDVGSAQGDFRDTFFKVMAVFLLTSQIIQSDESYVDVKGALIIAIFGVVILGLQKNYLDGVVGEQIGGKERLKYVGLLADPNDLTAIVALCFPFTWTALLKKLMPFPRVLASVGLLAASFLVVAVLFFAQSRGAVLAVMVSLGLMVVLRYRLRLLPVLLIGTMTIFVLQKAVTAGRSSDDLSESSSSRLNYWKTGVRMAIAKPFLGVGYKEYPANYERYAPEILYEWGERTAHSTWVLILAECGIPALLVFVALWWEIAKRAWSMRFKYPELICALVAYTVAMSLLSHSYVTYAYILWGVILGAWRSLKLNDVSFKASAKTAGLVSLVLISALGLSQTTWAADASGLDVAWIASTEKPLPGFSPTRGGFALSGARGETVSSYLVLKNTTTKKICGDLQFAVPSDVALSHYEMKTYSVKRVSYRGGRVGEYDDALVPLEKLKDVCLSPNERRAYWQDWTIGSDAKAVSQTLTLKVMGVSRSGTLKIWNLSMPEQPSLPIYSELTTWYLLLGHYGKWHDGEETLAKLYLESMKAHRISSLKTGVKLPDLHNAGSGNDKLDLASLHQLRKSTQLPGTLLDLPTPMAWSKTSDRDHYLTGLSKSLLPTDPDPLIYLWDEPKPSELGDVLALARRTKTLVPRAKILITMEPDSRFENSVDIFVPLLDRIDHIKRPQSKSQLWAYVSCMSHGCEGPPTDSGAPDLVIDRPSVWVRSIGWIAARVSLSGFLYYSVDNGFRNFPKRDPWKDLYDFGGNGDGTLYYPLNTPDPRPAPSIRLKLLRQASYDHQYLTWMSALPIKPDWYEPGFKAIVSDATHWSKNMEVYENFREKMGDYLASKAPVSKAAGP